MTRQIDTSAYPFGRPDDDLLIRALVEARKLIFDNKERYICLALDEISYRGEDHRLLRPAARYLRWFIKQTLRYKGKNHSTMETYLNARRSKLTASAISAVPNPKEARLQWIDWMKDGLERKRQKEVRKGQAEFVRRAAEAQV